MANEAFTIGNDVQYSHAQEGRVRFATAFRLEDRGNGGDRSRPALYHAAGRPRRARAAHRSAATQRARHPPATPVPHPTAEPERHPTPPEPTLCGATTRPINQAKPHHPRKPHGV